ncbi:tyrosine-type recombinase/integrase [Siccirubricoccus deserti]
MSFLSPAPRPAAGERAGRLGKGQAGSGPARLLRLHDLRHSFASALANRGHSLYEIGQILGHKQVATTTRYAHLSQDRLVAAANAVGEISRPSPASAGDVKTEGG